MIHGIKRLFEEMTGREVRSQEQIKEGITNENYLINDAFVLRYPRKDHDECINYKLEKEVYEKIEPLKISEKIVVMDTKTGIKISKFVHNTRFYFNTPTDEQIRNTVKTLKKLHSAKIKVSKSYEPFKKLDYYKKYVESAAFLDERYEKLVKKAYEEIDKKEEYTLCHNDLVHHNLLYKYNGFILIDWEYASMNSPLFDLASFISENNLSEEQETYFLKLYYGFKFSNLKMKKVDAYVRFLDILFYYWALHYYKKRGDKIYYDIAIEKFNRIKEGMISLKGYYKY